MPPSALRLLLGHLSLGMLQRDSQGSVKDAWHSALLTVPNVF